LVYSSFSSGFSGSAHSMRFFKLGKIEK